MMDASPTRSVKQTRRVKRAWLIKSAMLLVSLIVSFGLAEVGVRVAKPGFPGFAVPQVKHRPAAGIGYEMIPLQKTYTYAEPVTVNSLGLRGPELAEKSPQDIRICCLGDSFTFGVGVSDENAYPRQLEAMLATRFPEKRIEVVNAGVQGYATYHEIDWLRRRGVRLAPDLVVLAVYLNDLVVRPAGDYSARYQREDQQARDSARHRMPRLYGLYRNSALLTLVKRAALAARHGQTSSDILQGTETDLVRQQWVSLERELASFGRLSEEHGFATLVCCIPARIQVTGDFPQSLYPARVHEICQRLGIATVELVAPLKSRWAEGVDPYLPWDNHLSPAGNHLVAQSLEGAVERLIEK